MLAYNDSNNYPPFSLRMIGSDTESRRTPYIPLQRPKYYKGYSSETFDLAVNSVVLAFVGLLKSMQFRSLPRGTMLKDVFSWCSWRSTAIFKCR